MSDLDRLLGWLADGTLIRPGHAGAPTLVDLARALAGLCGAPPPETTPSTAAVRDAIGGHDHFVVAMIDGLGLDQVKRRPAASFLRAHLALEMTSVFPSSTGPALTSMATGAWPGEHGVTGWWTRLPAHDLTATVLPFVERESGESLAARGIPVNEVLPVPSLIGGFTHEVRCWQPEAIADTVYSRYAQAGRPIDGYAEVERAVDAIVARVRAAAAPTYTYLYFSGVDSTAHEHGPSSPEVAAVVDRVDAALGALAAGLDGRARLVATADHGLIDVPDERKHTIGEGHPLLPLLACRPPGEARAPTFHLAGGAPADRFADLFREHLGERFALLEHAQVERLELFGPGPLGAAAARRVGPFVALAPGIDVIHHHADYHGMRGYHGGLTPTEMRIPLVVA